MSRLAMLDAAVLRVLRTRCHGPLVEAAAIELSRLGEHSRLWFSLALAGAARQPEYRRVYVRLLWTLAAAEVANALIKLAIDRPRPTLAGLPPLMSTRSLRSFPSAHATTSFAAARLLSQALRGPAPYGAAVAMALTRPYAGVHYPSDVLAGMALGTVFGEIASR